MVDLSKLPQPKQMIQLRMCLTLETQRLLEHTLQIAPSTDKTVNEVLDTLQTHIKGLRNEALRRRELLSCKQQEGESFADFYVRIRRIAEEVDVCPGKTPICEETQLKMVILMGIRDSELVQKLISMDSKTSLQDFVTKCRSYEAARCATTAITAPQVQNRVISSYKKNKGTQDRDKALTTKTSSEPAAFCQCCAGQHGSNPCPAAQSTCNSCANQGHWSRTVKCPATNAQCRLCGRTGHYDKCCKVKKKHQGGSSSSEQQVSKTNSCYRLGSTSSSTSYSPQPICVTLSYGGAKSCLEMLPDTGSDVTVIGQQHLASLDIPMCSLRTPPPTMTLTADGSQMAPALGTFQATLTLGKRSCHARIQVHDGVQTPLLSYTHCKELAIISRDFPKPRKDIITSEESSVPDADKTLQEQRTAARADPSYVRLLDCVTSGFPTNRCDLHSSLLPYWNLREDLYADGDLVLYGARVVVPATLRCRTLQRLHDSHRGVEATKRRARQAVFWPGINSDITKAVQACELCQILQPSLQQEPLMNDDHPTRPFESVSADFFMVAGKSFLVVVDRLSGWPVLVPCKGDTTASATIRIFCRYFREVGVPLRLRTDGGPQFTSHEFRNFLERWGVRHVVSSPHYPQSNGHAEAAVKSIKHLILKTAPSGNIDCEEFARGLLELRNTPTFTGRSPAQFLYGHPLRSCLPAHPRSFAKEWQTKAEDCDTRAAHRASQVKARYDAHAQPLPRLRVGQQVRVQDPTSKRWDRVGVVMSVGKSRDYELRLPSGRVYWRNRRFLRPVPESVDLPHSPVPVAPRIDQEKRFLTDDPPFTPRRSERLKRK